VGCRDGAVGNRDDAQARAAVLDDTRSRVIYNIRRLFPDGLAAFGI